MDVVALRRAVVWMSDGCPNSSLDEHALGYAWANDCVADGWTNVRIHKHAETCICVYWCTITHTYLFVIACDACEFLVVKPYIRASAQILN